MSTNVVSRPREVLRMNDEIAGANRLRYSPYASRLAGTGNQTDYWDGKFKQERHVIVNFDVAADNFVGTTLAEALTPATTEFAQAHARPKEFAYNRTPLTVEVRLSNLQDTPLLNIKAGMIRRLDQEFDNLILTGGYGNAGLWELPESVELDSTEPMIISNYSDISTIVALMFAQAQNCFGMEPPASEVTLSVTPFVMGILRTPIPSLNMTGLSALKQAYEDITIETVPIGAGLAEHISMAVRPMINLHHGLLPELYNEEETEHGLGKSLLFAFETAALELEDLGAYIYQKVQISA